MEVFNTKIRVWTGHINNIFFSLSSKIFVDGDCSHKIKRRLLLGRKAMTNPNTAHLMHPNIAESERGEWKVGLKLNIQKTKIMASGPIISWEMDGETVETVSDFIWGGSKITADGDCSHKIKRRLLLGRKVMTNLDSIFKSRDITLPTKVCLVKAMVFPVVMYGCASWTVKKAEHRRIDAFEV